MQVYTKKFSFEKVIDLALGGKFWSYISNHLVPVNSKMEVIMGSLYKRGNTWWIKYYRNGKSYRESSKSTKKMVAKKLLDRREGEIAQGRMPGIIFEKVAFDGRWTPKTGQGAKLYVRLLRGGTDYGRNQKKAQPAV